MWCVLSKVNVNSHWLAFLSYCIIDQQTAFKYNLSQVNFDLYSPKSQITGLSQWA